MSELELIVYLIALCIACIVAGIASVFIGIGIGFYLVRWIGNEPYHERQPLTVGRQRIITIDATFQRLEKAGKHETSTNTAAVGGNSRLRRKRSIRNRVSRVSRYCFRRPARMGNHTGTG